MVERVCFKIMFSGKWNFKKSCLSVNKKVPTCLVELKPPLLKGCSSPAPIPGFLRIPEHCITCSSVCKMIILENTWKWTILRGQRKPQEGNLWGEVWMGGCDLPEHLCWWGGLFKIDLWPRWALNPFHIEIIPPAPNPSWLWGSKTRVQGRRAVVR